MRLQGVKTPIVLYILLLSLKAYGRGTKYNRFPFVELGTHGVYPTTVNYFVTTGYNSINPPIHFGDNYFKSTQISQNGYISFEDSGYNQAFSYLSDNNYIIAPYWDDLYDGRVRYELYGSSSFLSSAQSLKNSVANYINKVLGVSTTVETLLVVEWKDMMSISYGGNSGKTNTFQALLTSSRSGQSYAIFTYKCGELQWGGTPTIGFKARDYLYRNHPFSRNLTSPNPIACVNYPASVWSNVVYKIDSSAHSCQYSQFGCSSGLCVPISYKCNGTPDCSDGTDEVACSPVSCFDGQFTCRSGECVSSSKHCDSTWDCSDGSDEYNCQQVSVGAVLGIVCAGLITASVFCVIIVSAVVYQVKRRRRRRAQFERLRSQISVRPQTTPTTQTMYFHPKPGEWYQTIEGHWVEGPPPAYCPENDQGNPLSDEGGVVLIRGLGDRAASTPPTNVEIELENVSTDPAPVSMPTSDPTPIPVIPNDSNAGTRAEGSSEASVVNEVGVASEEGNPLEASSSDSSVMDSEDTPLIVS